MKPEKPVSESLFRDRTEGEAPVTSAELFFDLVFVFAVTQASQFLLHHLTWLGALEAAFLLLAVWSAWVDTVLITNLLDPARQAVRTALFALMAAGLVFASALPEAFGHRGLAFAAAFTVFQLGRTLFMVWATRSRPVATANFRRTAIWVAVYSAFWIAGGLVAGPIRLGCWAVALLLDYVVPALGYPIPGLGRSDYQELHIEGGHVAERTSLFVLIALGESVLETGAAFTELSWTAPAVAAMASGLLQAMAMWWIYFYWSSDRAKSVIARSDNPGRFIIRAFGYVPWIVVAGIVTAAVGNDLALAKPLAPPGAATAWVLIGGPALFLIGAELFEFGAFAKWSLVRLAGLLATLLLAALVPFVSTLTLSAAGTLILVAVAATERALLSARGRPS